jgi:hypothetical protein
MAGSSSFDPRPAKLGRNVSERSLRSRIVFADGRKAATSAVPKPELKGRNLASLQRGLFLRLPGGWDLCFQPRSRFEEQGQDAENQLEQRDAGGPFSRMIENPCCEPGL